MAASTGVRRNGTSVSATLIADGLLALVRRTLVSSVAADGEAVTDTTGEVPADVDRAWPFVCRKSELCLSLPLLLALSLGCDHPVVKSLIFPVHSRSMRWWSTGGSDNLQGEVLVGKHLTRELLDLVLQALTKEDFNEDFNEALDASGTANALQSLSKPNEDDHPLLTKLRACNRMPHHLQISADGVRVHVVFHVLPEWSRRRCLWRECFPVKSVRRHPKLTRDQSRSLVSWFSEPQQDDSPIRKLVATLGNDAAHEDYRTVTQPETTGDKELVFRVPFRTALGAATSTFPSASANRIRGQFKLADLLGSWPHGPALSETIKVYNGKTLLARASSACLR